MDPEATLRQRVKELEAAMVNIATLKPALGKRASIRGALVHVQSIARASIQGDFSLGIDVYDSQR